MNARSFGARRVVFAPDTTARCTKSRAQFPETSRRSIAPSSGGLKSSARAWRPVTSPRPADTPPDASLFCFFLPNAAPSIRGSVSVLREGYAPSISQTRPTDDPRHPAARSTLQLSRPPCDRRVGSIPIHSAALSPSARPVEIARDFDGTTSDVGSKTARFRPSAKRESTGRREVEVRRLGWLTLSATNRVGRYYATFRHCRSPHDRLPRQGQRSLVMTIEQCHRWRGIRETGRSATNTIRRDPRSSAPYARRQAGVRHGAAPHRGFDGRVREAGVSPTHREEVGRALATTTSPTPPRKGRRAAKNKNGRGCERSSRSACRAVRRRQQLNPIA